MTSLQFCTVYINNNEYIYDRESKHTIYKLSVYFPYQHIIYKLSVERDTNITHYFCTVKNGDLDDLTTTQDLIDYMILNEMNV